MDVRGYNEEAWDREVERGNQWTVPVGPGVIEAARRGQWEVLLTNGKPVPKVRVADYLMPVTANSPCRYVVAERARVVSDEAGNRFCAYARHRETLPGGRSYDVLDQMPDGPADETPVFTVPKRHYFMMGDNRDDSLDSRFPRQMDGIGFLPAAHLIGRALITFFSTDGSAEWVKPWTWFSAARWERIGETF